MPQFATHQYLTPVISDSGIPELDQTRRLQVSQAIGTAKGGAGIGMILLVVVGALVLLSHGGRRR